MMRKKIYSYQEYPPDNPTINKEVTQTQQHFANEVNINQIMAKYERTGFLTDPTKRATREAIFGTIVNQNMSYHDMVNHQNEVYEEFMQLPSQIRKRFGNDPHNLIEFLSHSKNKDEAQKLGLIPLPEKEKIATVRVVSEPSELSKSEPKSS